MSIETKLSLARSEEQRNKVYSEIYESYRGLLYFVAAKFDIEPGLRDDLVSEAFLSFFNYPRKSEIRYIKSFLVKTMENLCMDAHRGIQIEELKDEETAASDSMKLAVEELKALLGEKDFSLLYDYCVYGKSSLEMSKECGLSASAIRQRIKRIKAKVRKIWEI